MLDIDHFKAFNDVHGHAGGDALLAQFGKLLAEHSRGEDIACRYGGEEFTLILPAAPAGAALQRATAICSEVEAMRVQHMGRQRRTEESRRGKACVSKCITGWVAT